MSCTLAALFPFSAHLSQQQTYPIERKTKRRPLVSLILDHYYPEIHAGVVRAARELDWNLDDERCRGFHGSRFPEGWLPDGVLCTTATDPALHWLRSCPVPKVRLLEDAAPFSGNKQPDDIRTIALGHNKAGELAARHLLSLGTPTIAFYKYCQPREGEALLPRLQEACRRAGRPLIVLDYPGEHPQLAPSYALPKHQREAWLAKKLEKLPLPCALMADDDRFAVEVIGVATSMGLRVPEDLAVLGCEDLPLVQDRSHISVSSIDMDLEAVGYTGAMTLDRLMRGETVPERTQIIQPKRLVERQSTSTYVSDIPGISKAVLKIRRHYSEPITVASLARESGMSVRSLQRLFRVATGTTVSDALMERRLAAAAHLLRETNFKQEPIAIETGLGSSKNLGRLFKERYGMTPGQWRDMHAAGIS